MEWKKRPQTSYNKKREGSIKKIEKKKSKNYKMIILVYTPSLTREHIHVLISYNNFHGILEQPISPSEKTMCNGPIAPAQSPITKT